MIFLCKRRNELCDTRKCWICLKLEHISTIVCKVWNMPEYRVYCLNNGKDYPREVGYYMRSIKLARKVKSEE